MQEETLYCCTDQRYYPNHQLVDGTKESKEMMSCYPLVIDTLTKYESFSASRVIDSIGLINSLLIQWLHTQVIDGKSTTIITFFSCNVFWSGRI